MAGSKRVQWDILFLSILSGIGLIIPVLLIAGGWNYLSPVRYAAHATIWSVPLLLIALLGGYRREKLVACLSFLGLLLIVAVVPWNTPVRFAHSFYGIQPGMSVAEVRVRMEPWVRGAAWPDIRWMEVEQWPSAAVPASGAPPRDPWALRDGTLLFPGKVVYHGTRYERELNDDVWQVRVANGRVVCTSYYPD
jgi:hypothetical protein